MSPIDTQTMVLNRERATHHSPIKDSKFHQNVSESPSLPSPARHDLSPHNLSMKHQISSASSASSSHTQPSPEQINIEQSRTPSPNGPMKGPILVPGIPANLVRPFPGPVNLPTHPNEHFLAAAQFQMAAALAHNPAGHGYLTGSSHPQHQVVHPHMPRESYPLYPWLMSRHGRIFPHRFPGSKSYKKSNGILILF